MAGLVERRKLIARVKHIAAGSVAATLLLCCATLAHAEAQYRFASKELAFAQGYGAFKGRQYEMAVPALKFAAEHGVMRAKFYLAKIYSDNSGGWTNHARAYELLREIIDNHANIDPKDYRVAPFVSQALTSIARYEREGIKAINLKPDTQRALVFFNHAASYFNDEDAQFELARHYLAGDGVETRVRYALNWLAKLSRRGHAGAQAFLANIYWDGRYTLRDPERALALVTVAVENAKEEDRFWIEDLHQNIFCAADRKTRLRVHDVVGGWRRRFGRTQAVSATSDGGLPELAGSTQRVCANGDIVGELAPGPDKRGGLNGSTVAASSAQPGDLRSADRKGTTTSSLRMSRIKPDRSDKRHLNGFVLREANGAADGHFGSSRPVSEQTVTSRSRSGGHSDRSKLNGFVLQGGTTSYGFSFAPKR